MVPNIRKALAKPELISRSAYSARDAGHYAIDAFSTTQKGLQANDILSER